MREVKMMGNKLLACPFCGGSVEIDDKQDRLSDGRWAFTHFCGNGDSPSNITFYSNCREGIEAAWNRRATIHDQPEKEG